MADIYKVMNTNSLHDLWYLIQKRRQRERVETGGIGCKQNRVLNDGNDAWKRA